MALIGRPREFDRGAALEAAMLAFWRKGFAATSMNDLCDAMGVRSPSLYAAFGSKEALYLEAVEHYVEIFGPPVWDKLAEGATARAGVENLLLAATESLPESHVTPPGCMATLAAGTYAFRLSGQVLRARISFPPRATKLLEGAAVILLAALVATTALSQGHGFSGVARPAGVLVGGLLAWRKAPFLVVVIAAAGVTAGLRLLGVP